MSTDAKSVLTTILDGFQDDLLEYLITAVDDMTLDEKRSVNSIHEFISPFLLDTGTYSCLSRTAIHLYGFGLMI
jgi:hypothetical protein